ncbi:unnamed protein product [Rotaria socialis]|uniref:Uncharacterized protein n=1 Tax=Rotaria socialis TaxID=392032 RepID=A0A818RGK1_9BILA|nr:unnamed protein product [Rotaria socialis]CAF4567417.1 unnamed protein product [Rotaria socialis]
MSQSCSIHKYIRAPRGCCQKSLCLQHSSEHNALLVGQLNSFTDEINALDDRLRTLNTQNTTSNHHQKRQQWRDNCHKEIDCLLEKKCQDLDQVINENMELHRKELNRIHLKITDLTNTQEATRQDIDSLNATIHPLKSEMNKIE